MATVTAARSVADGGIEDDDPAAATRSDDAASSMLEKGKRNKNGTKDIGIQAFDAILQLGVGCSFSCDVWGPSTHHAPFTFVGEERKFPSSPATAKITKVGLQLHFGWAHAHPGNRLSNLKILARYL